MVDSGDNHFREELGRRTLEISDLREMLAAAQDRVLDAEDRALELQQKIKRLEAELTARRVANIEMDSRVGMEEIRDTEARQRLASELTVGAAEAAQFRCEIEQGQATKVAAQAAAQEAHRRADELEGEVGTVRARIEALRRDTERQREDFARDQAAEETRRMQSATTGKQEAIAARSNLARLETSLAMEREGSARLDAAMQQSLERHRQALESCERLGREAEARLADEAEAGLQQSLDFSRRQVKELTQEMTSVKREAFMETQMVQGALEETRRMLTDHLDQTARDMEETQRCPEASPLAELIAILAEARRRVESSTEGRRHLEGQLQSLEMEVRQGEEALASEQERRARQRLADVEQELGTSRRVLEHSSHRAGSAQEAARRAEEAVAEAERVASERESLLRSKLEQLWVGLRGARHNRLAAEQL